MRAARGAGARMVLEPSTIVGKGQAWSDHGLSLTGRIADVGNSRLPTRPLCIKRRWQGRSTRHDLRFNYGLGRVQVPIGGRTPTWRFERALSLLTDGRPLTVSADMPSSAAQSMAGKAKGSTQEPTASEFHRLACRQGGQLCLGSKSGKQPSFKQTTRAFPSSSKSH